MFLQYADIGFLSAGQKYAAQFYGKNDIESEIGVLGFVLFVLMLFVIIYMTAVALVIYDPTRLISKLTLGETSITRRLLIILALSAPIILIQRVCQVIFSVRIEDYINQRVEIMINIIKIGTAYFFFRKGFYSIVSYFAVFQFLNLIQSLIGLTIIKKLYNYDLKLLWHSIKYSSFYYHLTKNLAYSSLFITIAWILYYESDTIVIGKLFNSSSVAIYAIGLSVLSFTRGLYNTIYSPFLSRFNHFIGQEDERRLLKTYSDLVTLSFPLCIIPILALYLLMPSLIIGWVGNSYIGAITIARILLISVVWTFISHPLTYIMIAKEKISHLYINTIISLFIFYLVVIMFKNLIGFQSVALAKSMAVTASSLYLLFIAKKIVSISLLNIILRLLPSLIISLFVLIAMMYLLTPFWLNTTSKNTFYTAQVVMVGVFSSAIGLFTFYFSNTFSRNYIISLIKKQL